MYLEYFALLIPVLGSLIVFLLYKHKLVWWEMLLPIAVCALMIVIWSSVARGNLTNDKEIWNDNVVRLEYYEYWDEWISQTCSSTCCCDSKGNNCSTTYYDCSYQETHPPYWLAITKGGWSISIRESDYKHFRELWNNNNFKDMHRDYDDTDGDMYYTNWDKNILHSLSYSKAKTYENKTQAAFSNFEFEQLDTADARLYGLYDYPKFQNEFEKDFLIGYEDRDFQQRLAWSNGINGPKHQLVNWFIIFRNAPMENAFHQESYWQGGNKNEAVTCISVDDNYNIQWAKTFSWTEQTDFIYDMEHMFKEGQSLKSALSVQTIKKMDALAGSSWKRKEFGDFDYITVPLHSNTVMWIYILTFIVTVGALAYGVLNEFEYDEDGKQINTKWNNRYSRHFYR